MPLPIDWNADDGSFKPGIYLARVKEAAFKRSQMGNDMVALTFAAMDFEGRKLCHDNLMLSGNGWGLGKAKLKALGIQEGSVVEVTDLLDRMIYIAVKSDSYNGRTRLAVDISQGSAGYWPESTPPANVTKPQDTPF